MGNDISDDTRRWDAFIGWARRFYEWEDFDEQGVDGTLDFASRLETVLKTLNGQELDWAPTPMNWLQWLHVSLEPRVNGLRWKVKRDFEVWSNAHPEEARQALLHLWDSGVTSSVSDRVDRFVKEVAPTVVHDAREGASLASCLLTGLLDPTAHPIYGEEVYEPAYRLTGYPDQPAYSSGAIYQHALDFLDRLLEEARQRGLPIQYRLDAHWVLWSVVRWTVHKPPLSEWPVPDRERLVAYRLGYAEEEAVLTAGSREDEKLVWMFQYEPGAYDLVRYVREHGPIDWWKANQGSAAMRLGQRVYFLRTGGDQAAIVAIGRIVSQVYAAPPGADHRLRVNVLYEAQVEPPLPREPDLRGDAVLGSYYPLRQGQSGTNFRLPSDVVRRLEEVVRDRLRPFPEVEPDLGTPPVQAGLDARTRVVAEVVRRWGQSEFRQQLLDAYERRCAVTGCDAVEALEAAHIAPYRGPHSNSVTNGLPLRADIHALFDLGLLAIDTDMMTVLLAPSLAGTTYAPLAGQPLRLPADVAHFPDRAALDEHRRGSGL